MNWHSCIHIICPFFQTFYINICRLHNNNLAIIEYLLSALYHNKNYEEKIDNFNDDEKINIGFEVNENINNDESEKDIQLFFETKKEGELS